MKRVKVVSILLAGVLLAGCSVNTNTDSVDSKNEETMNVGQSTEKEDNPIDIGVSEDNIDEVIHVMNEKFKFDVSSSHLSNSIKVLDASYVGENVMFSPLSLDFVLGMLANGADDATREYYELYLGQSVDKFNDFSKSYLTELPNVIEVANGVFVKNKYTVNEDTNNLLESCYLNKVHSLDFDKSESVSFINNWCSEATHGMINEVVNDISTHDSIVANVLYFKDAWATPVTNVNEHGSFTNMSGESEKATMLSFKTSCYFENDFATGFMKSYENKNYGFVAILPKVEGEFSISDLDLDSFISSKTNCSVESVMPEFSFDNKLSLTNILKTLGLDVFDNGVYDRLINESGMTLSEILQLTKIDVDRNGTEASAVTMGFLSNTSIGFNEDMKSVVLDRPFVFMIYDFENNVPLFVGKVISMK